MKVETAYFAAGCFWGVEHWFKRGPGVLDAVSGYMQGHTENPTYKEVCTDTTGHAETVKVTYDANRITYRRLVEAFFAMHDPTQLNRQGPDVGDQYRSGIWTVDDGAEEGGRGGPRRAEGEEGVRREGDRDDRRAGEDVLARRGVPPGVHREERRLLPREEPLVRRV